MQVGITKYANYLQQWIKPFIEKKQPEQTTERCCISISSNEISFIHLNQIQDTTELLLAETFKYEDLDSLPLMFSGFVKTHDLSLIPTYWLLIPEDYQLFLIESLSATPEELNDALKWRIRSLINYPLEEAVIDYFMLPTKKSASNTNPFIAAIAAKAPPLTTTIKILEKCGINLTIIDIPELALRNLSAFYEKDEKSTAFIYFYENIAILNITHKKSLYFTRRINLYVENESIRKDYEQLSLDLLRYFDYFQSQWRYPSPNRIFIASEKSDIENIATSLSKHLLLTVEPFPLNTILVENNLSSLVDKKFLLPIGCALRKDT